MTYLGSVTTEADQKSSASARIRIDGGKVYAPALHRFPGATQAIGSPSVRTGPFDDVYLTLVAAADPAAPDPHVVIGVIVQPLIAWLWVGGGIMALGTLLAAWPRDRRRATEEPAAPPSAETPVPGRGRPAGGAGDEPDRVLSP